MKANLKKTLPQEGTGYSLAGESLGGPSGSSCPTYSGGGQDRYRYRAPRNTEAKEVTETCLSNLQNRQGLNLIFDKDREVEDMVLALHANRQKMGNLEDQSSSTLHKHMLEAVIIVEKIASFAVGPQDQRTLNDAALTIKKVLIDIMNIEAKRLETRTELLALRRELIEKKAIVQDRLELTSDGDLENKRHSVTTGKKTDQRVENEQIDDSTGMVNGLKANFIFNRSVVASEVNKPSEGEQQGAVTDERLSYRTEKLRLSANQELGDVIQAVNSNNLEEDIAKVENHAVVKKKAAKEIKEKPENTVIDMKETLEELQKLSDYTTKERQMKKSILFEVHKGLPEVTTLTESLAPHIPLANLIDSHKMSDFIEKYPKNSIHTPATSNKIGETVEIEQIEPFPRKADDLKSNFFLNTSYVASGVNNPTPPEQIGDINEKRLTYRMEEPLLIIDQKPGEVVQALCINKLDNGKIEDRAAIKKRVTKDVKENQENSVIDVKDVLEELQQLSDSTTKTQQVKKTALLNMSKELLEPTTQPESLASPNSIEEQLFTNIMTRFLEKYLQNTKQECDSRKNKSLQNRNDNLVPKKANKCNKRSYELCTSPTSPEPVYDVWYVEDRFNKLTLKRVDRNEEKSIESGSSESDDDTDTDANITKSRDAVNPREIPSWWSTEIAELRKLYIAARRKYARSRRRKLQRDEAAEEQLHVDLVAHKKTYNKAIKRAKAKCKPEASENS